MTPRMGLAFSFLLVCCLARSVSAGQIVDAKVETKLAPSPVEYAVLLPDGYETAKDPLPLLLFLHGGGGDKSFLTRMRSVFDELWKEGTLPPMVVATPSAGRSFYMDYKDGSQKWETFIVTEFLDHHSLGSQDSARISSCARRRSRRAHNSTPREGGVGVPCPRPQSAATRPRSGSRPQAP
jgi:S-formylglutathione hydrolase FrmB